MNKLGLIGLIVLCVCLVPLPVLAGDFDGSRTLLFSAIDVIECTPRGECLEVTAESIALPQFLKIDFKEKKITPSQKIEGRQGTDIEHMERVDGKLILQGAEDGVEGVKDGLGWTLAIEEDTGKAVLTASGQRVAFVVFGACTPL
jgi:hypothetical protein